MHLIEKNIELKVKNNTDNSLYVEDQESFKIKHFRRPYERPFTRSERENTTLLFGGLTWKHERLLQGYFEGMGYSCEMLPNSTLNSLQIGKEYCDPGCCNPTYFTCGSLIEFLKSLEKEGISKQTIIDRYVFFTAGSCGPCRFGMYESQYRLALKNAGFEGFRVIIFQQGDGLDQTKDNAGLEFSQDFFLGVLMSFIIADIANDLAYQIRPFEKNSGQTDKVLHECIEIAYNELKISKKIKLPKTFTGILKNHQQLIKFFELIIKIVHQLFSNNYNLVIQNFKKRFSEIEVDYLRTKPVVKIIGEFWAQTTEGDGNFNMHKFLESEGAQVIPEPLGNWILYISHQTRLQIKDRIKSILYMKSIFARIKLSYKLWFQYNFLVLGEILFKHKHDQFRRLLNYKPLAYAPQDKLRKLAEKYFNPRIEGGEGHLEVGKSIYYSENKLCNMLVSLKPFGCMPSTQSDGVMSTVTNHYPSILFIPIETSGEGTINAYSRVQMTLNEAKERAESEMTNLLKPYNLKLDDLKNFVKSSRNYTYSFFKMSKSQKVCLSSKFARTILKNTKILKTN